MTNVMEALEHINKSMKGFGFDNKLIINNDFVKITEDEVVISIPYELKLTISKDEFEKNGTDAIKKAINQAVSNSVSREK